MINVPKKIFERNINDIEIGISEIHLYTENEIEKAQIGYSIDNQGNTISEWIGDKYLVIGHDSCCGDPIIADISNEEVLVYSMLHDDWNSLQKIADNFKQYIDILNKINETNLKIEQEKDDLILNINKMVSKEETEYWHSIIQAAYEFLNGLV